MRQLSAKSKRYNSLVADIPKVPKDQFEAVIKALLNTPPKPLKEIQGKQKPSARKKK